MAVSILLLLLGFVLLTLGAERLLSGSISLAARYNIPNIIVGLIIVSLCTSAPEFFSSLKASYISPDISVSNILGSNIFNILGILGLISILQPISTRPFEYKKELILLFLSGGLLAFFLISNPFSSSTINNSYIITKPEGFILILVLMFSLLRSVLKSKKIKAATPKLNSLIIELSYIILGVALLITGSHFAITHSIVLAKWLGLSQSFIGLTVVGVATGLPELITSLVSVYKKQHDIAITNIVGSNLFNLLGVIGVVSLINPINVMQNTSHLTDILFSSLCAILLFFTMLWKANISKIIGIIYICLYICFIWWKLI
ncbi:MAG: hypothetical protein HAW60_03595 [Bdellovibrionales bacterium]|nr:hypothetical protein [Bdellovibrionales bacterium]